MKGKHSKKIKKVILIEIFGGFKFLFLNNSTFLPIADWPENERPKKEDFRFLI